MALHTASSASKNRSAKKSARCWRPKSAIRASASSPSPAPRSPAICRWRASTGRSSATPTSARRPRRRSSAPAAFVRHLLAERLSLRRAPEVKFIFDESVAAQDRIEQIIQEIHAEAKSIPSSTRWSTRLPSRRRRVDGKRRRRRQELTSPTSQRLRRPISGMTGSAAARRADRRHSSRPALHRRVASAARRRRDRLGRWRWRSRCARSARRRRSSPTRSRRCSCSRFPSVDGIQITPEVDRHVRRGADHGMQRAVAHRRRGLDRSPVINIDHHPGNTVYGAINWIDESAAACGEMVFTLIEALGAPLTADIATHVYLAILTDTGSFHFSHLTPRTYEIAGRCGRGRRRSAVDRPHALRQQQPVARAHLRRGDERDGDRRRGPRRAALDHAQGDGTELGGTNDDLEGLINFPLTVKDIEAVAFFKEVGDQATGASACARRARSTPAPSREQFGGGGHTNAAGCGWQGAIEDRSRQLFGAAAGRASQVPRPRIRSSRRSRRRQDRRARRRTTW